MGSIEAQPLSLARELLERHERPFAWGVSDCVQFAADAREFYGGRRPALPAYDSERTALRLIRAAGSLEEAVTAALGPPVPVVEAELGDTVLTSFKDTGPVLGVADPPYFWLRAERSSFMPIRLDLALKVWPCRKQRFR